MARTLLLCCLFLAAAGCAKVRPEADFAKAAALVAAAEDAQPLWVRTPEDAAFVEKEVRAVLARGVTMRDAVRLALCNNPGVQARFEEIGVARADVVQAGLPQNPSLAVLFGFPLFAGGPLGSLAGQAMVSVSDLAEIKPRQAKAQAELEREILTVGHDAMAAAREAKLAWVELAYARRSQALAEAVAAEVKKLSAAGKTYSQFGLADEARLATLEAGTARAALEVNELRARAGVAKARLARVMGLSPDQDFDIAGEVPDQPSALPDTAGAVAFAEANNLRVRAAAYAVQAAQGGADLEAVRWLKDFEVGAGYEYDIEGNRTLGPGASVKLPVFDQNQAQKAKAAFRVRQAGRLLQEARAEAREAAIRALEEAQLARATAEGLAGGVLPPARRAAKWADTYAKAMQLSELAALEAKLELLRERLRHNQALRDEQAALVNLEFALGGRIGNR